MDGQQFDRIARALGSGKSRRSVLRGVAAGVFGAIAGVRAIDQAGATITCAVQDQACTDNGDGAPMCCEGFTCTFIIDQMVCIADETCSGHYGGCETTDDCCAGEGLICSSGGECTLETVYCGTEWDQCGHYEGDILVGCCDGYDCVDGGEGMYCDYVCSAEGIRCDYFTPAGEEGDGNCCDGLVCNEEGLCAPPPPPPCSVEGEGCAENACCDGLTCLETEMCGYPPEKPEEPEKPKPPAKPVEPVVKLPDTGAGQVGEGADWLIPGALGAAAAAIAAQKLLSDKAKEADDTV